jgi:phosphoribosylaminoimidazole carboxylase/phosphoribosylaminoimidazole-succinocarboxamide synthase
MAPQKGKLLGEGKTKRIYECEGRLGFVIVENMPNITAHDDPSWTKQFEAKARYAATTACRVFELLKAAGLPVAYEEQISDTEFVASLCKMIPLECVIRRLAVGSYLKRHPEYDRGGERPHRFHRLVFELFLKSTEGKVARDGDILFSDLSVEDPFIANPYNPVWNLFHPKKPSWEASANLDKTVERSEVLSLSIGGIEKLNRMAFLIIESAWAILGYLLVDFKLELGITPDGRLVIADVIDNDSWRLRDRDFKEVSKQLFRDGQPLDEVEAKYGHVAELVSRFNVPEQALVFWRGSTRDTMPESFRDLGTLAGLQPIEIVLSGHKQTRDCLQKLEELQRDFPAGGVIIAKVGMSNGLGPILAAHTNWPVISVPASSKDFPEDVWSSLRVPSAVPMATVLSDANAIDLALNILGQTNPAIYACQRYVLEERDSSY